MKKISAFSLIVLLLLSASCAHNSPLPADLKAEDDLLRQQNQTLRRDLKEAEDDLSTAMKRIQDCEPLIKN